VSIVPVTPGSQLCMSGVVWYPWQNTSWLEHSAAACSWVFSQCSLDMCMCAGCRISRRHSEERNAAQWLCWPAAHCVPVLTATACSLMAWYQTRFVRCAHGQGICAGCRISRRHSEEKDAAQWLSRPAADMYKD